jgi:histidyl-tRNA synthetase
MPKFQNPSGTADILPEDWPYWEHVLKHAQEVAVLFGYRRIETPTFGDTALFQRSTGSGTDIVDKEMYTFKDRSGDDLSLRPEGTAPVMRAYFQHGMHRLPQPVKFYYVERIYRYDRPQRGRLREHHQFGCEAMGLEDAFLDVELISLLAEFYSRIGLRDLTLHVNSIGDGKCRPAFVEVLTAYLRAHVDRLAEKDRERVERNPLRVLDSKEAASQGVIEGAPHMLEYLCDECRAHWEKLLRGLRILGLDYEIDHRLVRGLDYYTRTVFEFLPAAAGAQAVVGAGGRYDDLSVAMGESLVPGVGFGSGIERLILNLQDQGLTLPQPPRACVYAAHAGEGTEDAALLLVNGLRRANMAADMAFGGRSLKAQLKAANSSGAEYVTLVGEDELRDGTVTVKRLADGTQESVPGHSVNEYLTNETSS